MLDSGSKAIVQILGKFRYARNNFAMSKMNFSKLFIGNLIISFLDFIKRSNCIKRFFILFKAPFAVNFIVTQYHGVLSMFALFGPVERNYNTNLKKCKLYVFVDNWPVDNYPHHVVLVRDCEAA